MRQKIALPPVKAVLFQVSMLPPITEKVVEIEATKDDATNGEKGTRPVAETNRPLLDSWPLAITNGAAALQSVVVFPFVVMKAVATALGLTSTAPGAMVRRYWVAGMPLSCCSVDCNELLVEI